MKRSGLEQDHKARVAVSIAKRLTDSGCTAYFAGGCVRDFVMGRTPEDYDIATTATPKTVEELFEKTVPIGKQFGVILVIAEGVPFEVATFRAEGEYRDGRHPSRVVFSTPEQDAKRRDFTVNGLFFDPLSSKIIDFVDGVRDIESKIIRTIGNPADRFEEDKLRLLRAVRFSTNLGFRIESQTWAAIQTMAAKISGVSMERIREELIKLFTRQNAGGGLEMLSDSGLLKVILPEVEAMKGVSQSSEFHPEGDVFVHTKLVMNKLENPSTVLAFSALLHDVGKPCTFSNEGGKISFYTHARAGSDLAEAILRRLKFSNKEIDLVRACVDNHMKFANVREMRVGKLKQFISRSSFEDELELHRIDCEASHGNLENFRFLLQKKQEFERENLKPKPLINGHDLLTLGFSPGPLIKKILDEVYELQLEGKWEEKDEVLKWVQKKLC